MPWTACRNKKHGVAIYNWKGDRQHGLPLEIGDMVQILQEYSGWYRGFCTKNRSNFGIFPQSYITLRSPDGEAGPHDDPTVRECTLVLREWGYIWKKLYVEREGYKYTTLRKVMLELLGWRRALLSSTLTQDQTRDLKLKAIAKIDWGNRKLGLDLVPRRGSDMIDPVRISVVELHQIHVNGAEISQATSSRGTLRRKGPRQVLTHHLYFCMRDFGHRIGDDAEVFFSLFDAARMRGVSERFLVKISKEGFSNYVEKLHSNCTIFSDLGNADLTKNLYLVAHVMRVGKMMHSESSKKSEKSTTPAQAFRRPYGVAVFSLAEIISSTESEEREVSFKVYQSEEKDFHQLHELIIKKQNNKYSPLSGQPNYGIVISVKILHGELHQVKEENPVLFKNISLTSKMGFPDVIMPGDVRNDLYLTLERGEFERGGKSTGKNIEVTVLVLNDNGKILENCLWGASGTESAASYHSMIIYHHNSPNWNETIRLSVPIELFYNAHVRLEYRHCSTRDKADRRLFSFSFARLMENGGATLQDGAHDLYIYKCEDASRLINANYLNLPSSANDKTILASDMSSMYHRSPKEVVTVKTLLCSTKLTQNVDLLSLLQWKAHPERIQESLGRVLKLGDEELVKFLQDVLDALFSMFSTEDGNSTSHSGLVFHVLVSIFSLLDESKFQHFKPVMDAYIADHFAAALVYKGLLSSVQHCADWVSSAEKQEPIQKCFKSLEYIFKLIIQSRKLFAQATGGQYEDSFIRDLSCVFNSLNKMLKLSNEVILPTKEALLHSVGVVLEQLGAVLPAKDVGALAGGLLESVPNGPPILVQAKLCAIRDLVGSNLFKNDESRSIILAVACKHLRLHLSGRDELKLCAETLGEILTFLYEKTLGPIPNNSVQHDLDVLCISTLDMLMQTVLIILDRNSPVLGSLVACLLGLLQQLEDYHYKHLWDEIMDSPHDRKPLKDFLYRTFFVFKALVTQNIYPNDWLYMKMAANSIIRRSLEELAKPLIFKFLDQRFNGHDSGFDSQIWSSYFNLAVAFLTQPSLQLEMFSEVKREKVIEKYGDMRVLMGFQILQMWSQLGEHKLHFIPHMVGPFLEVTLVPEPELRKATLHIFYDMMNFEQRHRGSFKLVESELIDKLDILISENKGDDEYRQLFNTMEHLSVVLLEEVQTENPPWKESGVAFIVSVTRLLERLLDYRSVMQGQENRDKRMSCTVNLLNFYKNEINRKEMYLRYIYKLHDLHLTAENFTEAGFTMKLYADQLSWDSTMSLNDPNFPEQTECKRKETLYLQIIHYFDKGKCWEKGIPLCKELAHIYESKFFDYNNLSNILKTQAKFCENILTQLRPEPEYFRVGFYGQSFPLFVRNKQFVYRGLEYERIQAFTQRLQTEFPAAQILTKNTPPSDSILNSEGQYIQICTVRPLSENPLAQGGIPEKISRFYQVNDVKRFLSDRPNHKGVIDKDNEFKTLWIERTTLEISNSLPGILRWFEVTDRTVQEIAPVQYACEIMTNVARELTGLVQLYTQEPRRNINPFSMRLQGIIDANVMGGISKYQEAFFHQEFNKTYPDQAIYVTRLKGHILDQMEVLESALVLHGQLAPQGVQPLHRRLLERYSQLKLSLGNNFAKLKRQQSDSIVNTPLPPLPTEKRATSLHTNHFPNLPLDADDNIYTNPELEPLPNRDSLTLGSLQLNSPPAPPIPMRDSRPRSAGFNAATPTGVTLLDFSMKNRDSIDSPEIPPKPGHSRERSLGGGPYSPLPLQRAPPLPPKGNTPDKRASNPINIITPSKNQTSSINMEYTSSNISPNNQGADLIPNIPRRMHKYSIVDISLEENHIDKGEGDMRDSGFCSGNETLSNVNSICYEDYDFKLVGLQNQPDYKTICSELEISMEPPPIPPKCNQNNHDLNVEKKENNIENYSVPKIPVASDLTDSAC